LSRAQEIWHRIAGGKADIDHYDNNVTGGWGCSVRYLKTKEIYESKYIIAKEKSIRGEKWKWIHTNQVGEGKPSEVSEVSNPRKEEQRAAAFQRMARSVPRSSVSNSAEPKLEDNQNRLEGRDGQLRSIRSSLGRSICERREETRVEGCRVRYIMIWRKLEEAQKRENEDQVMSDLWDNYDKERRS
jgi:hypothetical protein